MQFVIKRIHEYNTTVVIHITEIYQNNIKITGMLYINSHLCNIYGKNNHIQHI